MGICASSSSEAHDKSSDRNMMTKLKLSNNKLFTPSSENVAGDLSTAAGNSQCPPPVITLLHDQYGSKEEIFFDSHPWLNSDSEDDFISVNGDFTPSRGSTPVHPSFSPRIILPLHKSLFGEKPISLDPEQSLLSKKSLVELFRESTRINQHDINLEEFSANQNKSGENGDVKSEEKPKEYVQCCIPRMRMCRNFIERKKKMNIGNCTG